MTKFLFAAAASAVVLSGSLFADTIQGTGTTFSIPTTASFTGSMAPYTGANITTNNQVPFWNNPSSDTGMDGHFANVGDVLAGLTTGTDLIGSNLVGGNIQGSYYALNSSGVGTDPITGSTTSTTYSSNDATALEFNVVRATTAESIATIYDNSSLTGSTTFGYYMVSGFTGLSSQLIPIYSGGGINSSYPLEPFNPGAAGTVYGFYTTVCYGANNTQCETYTTDNGNWGASSGGAAWNHFALFELANGNMAIGFEDGNGQYTEGIGDFNDLIVQITFASSVPEPGTIAMLGFGLVALAFFGRRRFVRS